MTPLTHSIRARSQANRLPNATPLASRRLVDSLVRGKDTESSRREDEAGAAVRRDRTICGICRASFTSHGGSRAKSASCYEGSFPSRFASGSSRISQSAEASTLSGAELVRHLQRRLARVEREERELWDAGAHPAELLLKRVDAVELERKIAQAIITARHEAA
jgi:hypothetical protein